MYITEVDLNRAFWYKILFFYSIMTVQHNQAIIARCALDGNASNLFNYFSAGCSLS